MNRKQHIGRLRDYRSQWPHMSSLYSGGSTREDENERYIEPVTVFDNVYENPSEPYGAYKFYMAPREEFVIQSEPHLFPVRAMYKEDDERTSGYATSGGSSTFRDGSTRRILLCVFLVFLLIGAIIAAVTMAVLISHQKKTKHVIPDTQVERVLESNIRIANRTYIPEYSDPNSKGYQILEAEFCEAIDAMFTRGESPLKDNYKGCKVLSFRYGSVMTRSLFSFILNEKKPDEAWVEEVKEYVKETIPKKGIWNPLLLDGKMLNFYPAEITKLDPTTRPPVIKTTPKDIVRKIFPVSKQPPSDSRAVSDSHRMYSEVTSTELFTTTPRKAVLSKLSTSLMMTESVKRDSMSRLTDRVDILYPSESSTIHTSKLPDFVSSSSKIPTPSFDLLLTEAANVFNNLLQDSKLSTMSSVKNIQATSATTNTVATASKTFKFDPSLQAEIDRVLGPHLPSVPPLSEHSSSFSSPLQSAHPELKISQTPTAPYIKSSEKDLLKSDIFMPSEIKFSTSSTVPPFSDDFFGFLFPGSPSSRNPNEFPSRFEIGDPLRNTADNLFTDGGFGGFLFPHPDFREMSKDILPPNFLMMPTQSVYTTASSSINVARVSSEHQGFPALNSEIKTVKSEVFEKTMSKLPPNHLMFSSQIDSSLTTSVYERQLSREYLDDKISSPISSNDFFREASSSPESEIKTDSFLKVQQSTDLRNTDLTKSESVTSSQTISQLSSFLQLQVSSVKMVIKSTEVVGETSATLGSELKSGGFFKPQLSTDLQDTEFTKIKSVTSSHTFTPSASLLQPQMYSKKMASHVFSGIIPDIAVDKELESVFDKIYNVNNVISHSVSTDYSLQLTGQDRKSAISVHQEGLMTMITHSLSEQLQSSELDASSYKSEYMNSKIFSDSTISEGESGTSSDLPYDYKPSRQSMSTVYGGEGMKTDILMESSKEIHASLNIDTMPSSELTFDKSNILPTASVDSKTDVDTRSQRMSSAQTHSPAINLILMSDNTSPGSISTITNEIKSDKILISSSLPIGNEESLKNTIMNDQFKSERSLISELLSSSQSTKITSMVQSPISNNYLVFESTLEKELQSVFNKFDNLRSIILPIDQTDLTISPSEQDKISTYFRSEKDLQTVNTMSYKESSIHKISAFEKPFMTSGDRDLGMASDSAFNPDGISLKSQLYSQNIQASQQLFSTSNVISETPKLYNSDNIPVDVSSNQIHKSSDFNFTDSFNSDTSLFENLESQEWVDFGQFTFTDVSFLSMSHSDSLINTPNAVALTNIPSVSDIHQSTVLNIMSSEFVMSSIKPPALYSEDVIQNDQPFMEQSKQSLKSRVDQNTMMGLLPSEMSLSATQSQTLISEDFSETQQLMLGANQSLMTYAHQSTLLDLKLSEMSMSAFRSQQISREVSEKMQATTVTEQSSRNDIRQNTRLDLLPSEISKSSFESQSRFPESISELNSLGSKHLSMIEIDQNTIGTEQSLTNEIQQGSTFDIVSSEIQMSDRNLQSMVGSFSESFKATSLGAKQSSMVDARQGSSLDLMQSAIQKSDSTVWIEQYSSYDVQQDTKIDIIPSQMSDRKLEAMIHGSFAENLKVTSLGAKQSSMVDARQGSSLDWMQSAIQKSESTVWIEQSSSNDVQQDTKIDIIPSQMLDRKLETMIHGSFAESLKVTSLGAMQSSMFNARQSSSLDLMPAEILMSDRKSQAMISKIASENVQLSILETKPSLISSFYQSTKLDLMASEISLPGINSQSLNLRGSSEYEQISALETWSSSSSKLDQSTLALMTSEIKNINMESQTLIADTFLEKQKSISRAEQISSSGGQQNTPLVFESSLPIFNSISKTIQEKISEKTQMSLFGEQQILSSNVYQSTKIDLFSSEIQMSDREIQPMILGSRLNSESSKLTMSGALSSSMNEAYQNSILELMSSEIHMSDRKLQVLMSEVVSKNVQLSTLEAEQSLNNQFYQSTSLNIMPSRTLISDGNLQEITSGNFVKNLQFTSSQQSLMSHVPQRTSIDLLPSEILMSDIKSQTIKRLSFSDFMELSTLGASENVQTPVLEFESSDNIHQNTISNSMISEKLESEVKSQAMISENFSMSELLSTMGAEYSLQSDVQRSSVLELRPSEVAMPENILQTIVSNVLSEKAPMFTYGTEQSSVSSVLRSIGSTTDEVNPGVFLSGDSTRASLYSKSSDSFYTSVNDILKSDGVIHTSVMIGTDRDFRTTIWDSIPSMDISSQLTKILDQQSSMLQISNSFTETTLSSSSYTEPLSSDLLEWNTNAFASISSGTTAGIDASQTPFVQFADLLTKNSSYTAMRENSESFIFENGVEPTTTVLSFATDAVFTPVQPFGSEMLSADSDLVSKSSFPSLLSKSSPTLNEPIISASPINKSSFSTTIQSSLTVTSTQLTKFSVVFPTQTPEILMISPNPNLSSLTPSFKENDPSSTETLSLSSTNIVTSDVFLNSAMNTLNYLDWFSDSNYEINATRSHIYAAPDSSLITSSFDEITFTNTSNYLFSKISNKTLSHSSFGLKTQTIDRTDYFLINNSLIDAFLSVSSADTFTIMSSTSNALSPLIFSDRNQFQTLLSSSSFKSPHMSQTIETPTLLGSEGFMTSTDIPVFSNVISTSSVTELQTRAHVSSELATLQTTSSDEFRDLFNFFKSNITATMINESPTLVESYKTLPINTEIQTMNPLAFGHSQNIISSMKEEIGSLSLDTRQYDSYVTMLDISPTQVTSNLPSNMNNATQSMTPLFYNHSKNVFSDIKELNSSINLFDSRLTTNSTGMYILPTQVDSYLPSIMNSEIQSYIPTQSEQTTPYDPFQDFLVDVNEKNDSLNMDPQVIDPNTDTAINSTPYFVGSSVIFTTIRESDPSGLHVLTTQSSSYEHSQTYTDNLLSISEMELRNESIKHDKRSEILEYFYVSASSELFESSPHGATDTLQLSTILPSLDIKPYTTMRTSTSLPPLVRGSSSSNLHASELYVQSLYDQTVTSNPHSNILPILSTYNNDKIIDEGMVKNKGLTNFDSMQSLNENALNPYKIQDSQTYNDKKILKSESSISVLYPAQKTLSNNMAANSLSTSFSSDYSFIHTRDTNIATETLSQISDRSILHPHAHFSENLRSSYTDYIEGSYFERDTNIATETLLQISDRDILYPHAHYGENLRSSYTDYIEGSYFERDTNIATETLSQIADRGILYPHAHYGENLRSSYTDYIEGSYFERDTNLATETLSEIADRGILYPHAHFGDNLRSSDTDYIEGSYFEISLKLDSLTQISVNTEKDRSSDISNVLLTEELQTISSQLQFSSREYQGHSARMLPKKSHISRILPSTSTNEISEFSFSSNIITLNSNNQITSTLMENSFKFDSQSALANNIHYSLIPPLLKTDISSIEVHARISENTESSVLENLRIIHSSMIDRFPLKRMQNSSILHLSTKSMPFNSKLMNIETSLLNSVKTGDATEDYRKFVSSSSLSLETSETFSSFAQNTLLNTLTEYLSQVPKINNSLLSSVEKTESFFASSHATQIVNVPLNSVSNVIKSVSPASGISDKDTARHRVSTIHKHKVISTVTGERFATSSSSLIDMSVSENKSLLYSQKEIKAETLITFSDVRSSTISKSHSLSDLYLFTAANDYEYYATELDFVTDNIEVTASSSVESSTIAPTPTKSDSTRFRTMPPPLNPTPPNSYESVSNSKTSQDLKEMGSVRSPVTGVPVVLPEITDTKKTQKDSQIFSNNSPSQNEAILSTQGYHGSPSPIYSSQATQIISSFQRFPQNDVTMTTPLITVTEQYMTSSEIPMFPDDPFAGFFGSGPAIPQWVLDMLGSVHESPKSSVNHFFRH